MTCPKCKGKTQVYDTVHVSWNETYRARKCLDCGHVFFTAEFEVEPNKRFKKEWNLYHTKCRKLK
jgi:transcriptional regulator NrdR family protein